MPETKDKYHHIPVKSASLFVKKSFRTITISASKGIKAVIGKLKSDPQGSTKTQKYLFDVKKWTMAEAKAWVAKHKKNFEATGMNADKKKKEYKFYAPLLIEKVFDVDNPPPEIGADVVKQYLGIFEAVISTSTMDREMDIISWSAIEKGARQLNEHGIVLFNHNHMQPPIGRFLKSWAVKYDDREGGEIRGFIGISKTAEMVWTLIGERILREMSIGGILKDADEFFDDKGDFMYRLVKDWDLFEASVVTIASNPEAVISNVLGKMLHDRIDKDQGGDDMGDDPDQTPEPDEDLPPEVPTKEEILETIQEQVKEALDSLKTEVLAEVDTKIEALETATKEDLTQLRTEADEAVSQVASSAETLFDHIFRDSNIEVEGTGSDSEPPEPPEEGGDGDQD